MNRTNPTRTRRSGESTFWQADDGTWCELRDATEPLLVALRPAEISCAVPYDCRRCALALGLKEQLDALDVVISETVAYIVLRENGKGPWIAWRFKVPTESRRAIQRFDREQVWPPGLFRLAAPPPSDRLDSKRAVQKRRRERLDQMRAQGEQRPTFVQVKAPERHLKISVFKTRHAPPQEKAA